MSMVITSSKEGVPCDWSCLLTEEWPFAAQLSYLVEVEIEIISLGFFYITFFFFLCLVICNFSPYKSSGIWS